MTIFPPDNLAAAFLERSIHTKTVWKKKYSLSLDMKWSQVLDSDN